jgi:hypothetical protein
MLSNKATTFCFPFPHSTVVTAQDHQRSRKDFATFYLFRGIFIDNKKTILVSRHSSQLTMFLKTTGAACEQKQG